MPASPLRDHCLPLFQVAAAAWNLTRGRCIGTIPMFTAAQPRTPREDLQDLPALLPSRLGGDVVLDHGCAVVAPDPDAARADRCGVGARPGLLFSGHLASLPVQAS